MDVSIGVSFDGFEDTVSALATARQVVAAGAESLWMAEHMGYREALVTSMAFRMNDPDAIVVPTAISPYLWHPSPTAMSLATLAEVGNAPVGVAVGVGNPLFLTESGKSVEKPVRAVREFIECMRGLWTGEGTHYEGEMFQLAGARLGFRPPQPLLVYIAATGEQMLALAGRLADGVVLSAGLSAAYCKTSLQQVSASAAAAGRDPASLRRASYLFFAIAQDTKQAIDLVRPKLAFLLRNKALKQNIAVTGVPVDQERIIDAISRRDMEEAAGLVSDDAVAAFSICGTPRECHDRLEVFVASGINEPVLMVMGEKPERDLALSFLRDRTGR